MLLGWLYLVESLGAAPLVLLGWLHFGTTQVTVLHNDAAFAAPALILGVCVADSVRWHG